MQHAEIDILSIEEDSLVGKKEQMQSFMEASKMFDELVTKGYAKRRGYTLRSADMMVVPAEFNVLHID